MRLLTIALAVVVCASPAMADEIILKSGGKLTGIVRSESDSKVVIEVAAGTASLDPAQIDTITKGTTKLHDYYDREARAEDGKDFVLLAIWAKENGLSRFYRTNMQKTLTIEPDNETARRALGFQKHDGRWMTETEIMRSKGMEKMNGRWVSPEERAEIVAHKLEMKKLRLMETLEKQKRKDDEEAALRKHPKLGQVPFGTFHRPSWFWTTPYYRPRWDLPYLYKTPPNAPFHYRPMGPSPAFPYRGYSSPAPVTDSEEFKKAVDAEVEKRVKEILERLEKEKKKQEDSKKN